MSGMPLDVAARLREIGPSLDIELVRALYEPLLAQQDRSGVLVQPDLAYGAHERHRLDLYVPQEPAPPQGWPVVVLFHGGGFIRGDKRHRANIGWYLAQRGFVVALPNYRLAPESRWPSGPEDVVAVWQWLRVQVRARGGDASRIVLMGESAGAAHVAAATLRAEFQPADWHMAGAVLMSGPYNAHLEGLARAQFGVATPDPRNEAYYGPDLSLWPAASTVDHVSARPFPLLITFAERDLLQMQVQAGELFARLVTGHGFQPELAMLRDHNHYSGGYSLGTSDETVAQRLLVFLRGVV
jgi:acetyl esterase